MPESKNFEAPLTISMYYIDHINFIFCKNSSLVMMNAGRRLAEEHFTPIDK